MALGQLCWQSERTGCWESGSIARDAFCNLTDAVSSFVAGMRIWNLKHGDQSTKRSYILNLLRKKKDKRSERRAIAISTPKVKKLRENLCNKVESTDQRSRPTIFSLVRNLLTLTARTSVCSTTYYFVYKVLDCFHYSVHNKFFRPWETNVWNF